MDSDRLVPQGGADFGEVAGRTARLYAIDNDWLRARITDYGGILVSLEAAAPDGGRDQVVLGFEDAADYAAHRGSFGALLGRNANRIAGGSTTIDGETYALSKNENGSTLHGGAIGFGKQFWSLLSTGFAVEPQGFPNAVNEPRFPSTIWRPGAAYHEEIVYRFPAVAAKAAA